MRDALKAPAWADLTYEQVRGNFDQSMAKASSKIVDGQKHETGRQFTTPRDHRCGTATVGHMHEARIPSSRFCPRSKLQPMPIAANFSIQHSGKLLKRCCRLMTASTVCKDSLAQ